MKLNKRNREKKNIETKKILLMIVACLCVAIFSPARVWAADTLEGGQPSEADYGGNQIVLHEPANTFIEKSGDDYINEITAPQNGTKQIPITIQLAAGMSNYSDDNFKATHMSLINVYDKSGNVAAEYEDGTLLYLSSKRETVDNKSKVTRIYLAIKAGTLEDGEYSLVFDKALYGNNVDKKLGKNVIYRFTVDNLPGLGELIADIENFISSISPEGIGDNPGQYPQNAINELSTALGAAQTVMDSSTDDEEKIQAAKDLKQAFSVAKAARIIKISSITISGIGTETSVGETGRAVATVDVLPSEDVYQKVTWESSAPDIIDINEKSGKWTMNYTGTATITATSTADKNEKASLEVTVNNGEADPGIVAVNYTGGGLEQALEKYCGEEQTGNLTKLKICSSTGAMLSADDRVFIKHLQYITSLQLEDVVLQEIDKSLFLGNTQLQSIKLPETLKTIGEGAFKDCESLTYVSIPLSLTKIGKEAFAGCSKLSELDIKAVYPPECEADAFDAFEENAKPTVNVPYTCGEDFESAEVWKTFNICEKEKVKLEVAFNEPGTVWESAQELMKKSNIKEDTVTELVLTSPEGVQMDNDVDLKGHFNGAIIIDLSGTQFEENRAHHNVLRDHIGMKTLIMPETTRTFGGACFKGCTNLQNVEIPETITEFGQSCFEDCTRLTSIILPKNVEQINNAAFSGCSSLETIICKAKNPPQINGSVFPGNLKHILVGPVCAESYKKAAGWSLYRNFISNYVSVLMGSSLNIKQWETGNLEAHTAEYGKESSDYEITDWKISDAEIADIEVDENDSNRIIIKPKKIGTATITAMTMDENVQGTCLLQITTIDAPSAKSTPKTYNKINLSWNTVPDAYAYEIYKATKPSGTYNKLVTVGDTAFADTGLKTGTYYYYKVRAVTQVDSKDYRSEYSKVLKVRTSPDKVKKLTLSKAAGTKIKVKWSKASGAGGYTVYMSTKAKSGFKVVKTTSKYNSVTYTTSKLKKGKKYYFKVRAYVKVGKEKVYGAYSPVKSRIAR